MKMAFGIKLGREFQVTAGIQLPSLGTRGGDGRDAGPETDPTRRTRFDEAVRVPGSGVVEVDSGSSRLRRVDSGRRTDSDRTQPRPPAIERRAVAPQPAIAGATRGSGVRFDYSAGLDIERPRFIDRYV